MKTARYTVVGHFDPAALSPLRPLDVDAIEKILRQYPAELRDHVEVRDGYVVVKCWPAPPTLIDDLEHFTYELAEQQGCVAAESPPGWSPARTSETARLARLARGWVVLDWSPRHG